jgi:hypothetical protein
MCKVRRPTDFYSFLEIVDGDAPYIYFVCIVAVSTAGCIF